MAEETVIAKYLTLEQISVFVAVYESVIQKQERFTDAVAALSAGREARDRSAVYKAIVALNRKFNQTYGMDLITREEVAGVERWSSSQIGREFFEFAKDVNERLLSFGNRLAQYRVDERAPIVFVRPTAWRVFAEIAETAERGALRPLEPHDLEDGSFEVAFSNHADIVVDELFMHEKKKISYNSFHYFQLYHENIVLAVDANARLLLPEPVRIDGFDHEFIDAQNLNAVEITLVRQPLYMRIAASVAATTLPGDSYVSSESAAALDRYYPRRNYIPSISRAKASLFAKKNGYALLMPESEVAELDRQMLKPHKKIGVLHNKRPLYYSTCVLVTRKDKERRDGSALAQWIAAIDEREQQARKQLPDLTQSTTATPVDYSNIWFTCKHCNNQISIDKNSLTENDVTVRAVCEDCMYVNQYDLVEGSVEIDKTASDIKFVPNFFADLFECGVCHAEFVPQIANNRRGHPYFVCENCFTVYQDSDARAKTVKMRCGSPTCSVLHSFRISNKKQRDETSCYETLQRIEYDAGTERTRQLGKLNLVVVYVDGIEKVMKTKCTHFGCGSVAERFVYHNKRGQHFSKCANCKNDIELVVKRTGANSE